MVTKIKFGIISSKKRQHVQINTREDEPQKKKSEENRVRIIIRNFCFRFISAKEIKNLFSF